MLLNDEYVQSLKAQPPTTCTACQGPAHRDYCRQCDDFFDRCTVGCIDEHQEHRTYWRVLHGLSTIDAFGIEHYE